MIQSQAELLDAILAEHIPLDAAAVWQGRVPARIAHLCQSPALLFEAFLRTPDMFPHPEEMLILWATNGESVTAYLRHRQEFVIYHPEDGPVCFQILGRTYQQMIGGLFSRLISAKTDAATLGELAAFFSFGYLDEIIAFVATKADWEENAHACIAALEERA